MISLIANLSILGISLASGYYLGVFTGAHYVPTSDETLERMLRMAKVGKDDVVCDLGSGNGKILIAAALRGAEAHGYEINPLLVLISRTRIRQAGVSGKAFVHRKNFWNVDLSTYTVVTMYGITHIMGMLDKKLERELPIGARVVCNAFPLPNKKGIWKEEEEKSTTLFTKTSN